MDSASWISVQASLLEVPLPPAWGGRNDGIWTRNSTLCPRGGHTQTTQICQPAPPGGARPQKEIDGHGLSLPGPMRWARVGSCPSTEHCSTGHFTYLCHLCSSLSSTRQPAGMGLGSERLQTGVAAHPFSDRALLTRNSTPTDPLLPLPPHSFSHCTTQTSQPRPIRPGS